MQVRVSPEVNALVEDATALSVRRGRSYVGVENLFEALLQRRGQLSNCLVPEHLKNLNFALQEVVRESWQGAVPNAGPEVFYTPRCAEIINESARLAERLGSKQATLGHLLFALMRDSHAAPSRAMDRLGLDRMALVDALGASLQQHAEKSEHEASVQGTVAKHESAEAAAGESPRESAPRSLGTLTRDLTALARKGKLETAVGRRHEVFHIVEVLTRRSKNNAILVGDAGTGKTRIIEGLAKLIVEGKTGGILANSRILELNLAALTAGTQYRGAFEERITALLDELRQSPDTILFIDEIHLIMQTGSTEGSAMDLANLLKPALARGELRCIGATTPQEYRKCIERDPALERRFQMIRIEELTPNATITVLERMRDSLEKHYGVRISDRAISAAVQLTQRYLPNRRQPDKAIDVLDQACARYRLTLVAAKAREKAGKGTEFTSWIVQKQKVTPHDIRKVVSRTAGIPVEEITAAERQRLDNLEQRLRQRIVGQDEALAKVVGAVKKSRAGLADPNRPEAVMLFLGPTGVGKTQLAKALADLIFGSSKHLITFDMSEYVEEHSVSRLLGAPPGYVGSDEEGRLAAAMRQSPFSILLFDEIEKAHPRIFDILLPVLDEGRIKDSYSREVSFRNTIIIFTSNVGAEVMKRGADPADDSVLEALRGHFRPEFINRIDDVVPFYPLLFEDIRTILKSSFRQLATRLNERGIHLRVFQGAYEHIAEQGYSEEFGARELRRAVDRLVTNRIGAAMLAQEFKRGDYIQVLMENGELVIRKAPVESTPNLETPAQ